MDRFPPHALVVAEKRRDEGAGSGKAILVTGRGWRTRNGRVVRERGLCLLQRGVTR